MTRPLPLLALGQQAALPALAGAQDRPPLGQVPVITEGLINTAIAYELDRKCDELEGRRLQGIAFLWSLEAEARRMGYSRDETRHGRGRGRVGHLLRGRARGDRQGQPDREAPLRVIPSGLREGHAKRLASPKASR
jgi:hypothetical protein